MKCVNVVVKKEADDYLRYWWHAHWVMWAVVIFLLLSFVPNSIGHPNYGTATRIVCGIMTVLRTIKKEKEKRKHKASKRE